MIEFSLGVIVGIVIGVLGVSYTMAHLMVKHGVELRMIKGQPKWVKRA